MSTLSFQVEYDDAQRQPHFSEELRGLAVTGQSHTAGSAGRQAAPFLFVAHKRQT